MPNCCPKTDRGMQHPISQVAVLVIDMLNPYRHEDADVLAPNVADNVDLIYVNDNYGDFTADFDDVVDAALHGERPDLVSPIAPGENCLRLLKVRHSAFSASSLDYLLGRLDAPRLILTGQVTEQSFCTPRWMPLRHFSVVVA